MTLCQEFDTRARHTWSPRVLMQRLASSGWSSRKRGRAIYIRACVLELATCWSPYMKGKETDWLLASVVKMQANREKLNKRKRTRTTNCLADVWLNRIDL